jgi:hypothetical protein
MRRAALAVLLGLCIAPTALAADNAPVFGLRASGDPKLGYFVYHLTPGSTRAGSVIVSNVGAAAGSAKLFVADGTTGQTSGTVYKTDSKPTESGTWVHLSRSSVTLRPNAHVVVPFTVRVPDGAKPGQWVAGIVAENAKRVATQKPGQKARVQIKIRDLTIVAVQVDVPGPAKVQFAIGDVTTGGTRGFQKAFVHFTNEGNLLVHPTGVVRISDDSGKLLQTLPFEMDTFLPETEIDYPLLLKKALGPGSYRAYIRLVSAGTGVPRKVFTATRSFGISDKDVKQVFTSAPPQAAPAGSESSSGAPTWALLAAAFAGGALVLAGLVLLLRRRSRTPSRPGTTVQRPPSAAAAADEPEPAVPPVPVVARPSAERCAEHDWDVAYDRGEVGEDGAWRYPTRCRNCGLELLARDVGDASEQARAGRP